MTVFKDTSKEAGALAKVAIALANGETPETTGTVTDDTGNRDVASILETPEAITKDNVKDAVDAGGVTAAELCTGEYAAALHRGRHQLILTASAGPGRRDRVVRARRASRSARTDSQLHGSRSSR